MIVLTAASMNLIGDWFYERLRIGAERGERGPSASPDLSKLGPTRLCSPSAACASRAVSSGRRHTIVSGLDLSVARGETVGIVGESGSGKSMTARALIGLLPAGVDADGADLYQRAELLVELPRAIAARDFAGARSACFSRTRSRC